MSNENRDYPEWLDRELFGELSLDEPAPAPKRAKEQGGSEPAKGTKKEPKPEDAPKKKKVKKAASAESTEDGKKPKAKKSSKETPAAPTEEKPRKSAKKSPKETPAAEGKKKSKKAQESAPKEDASKERSRSKKRKKARKAARGWLIGLIVLVSLALIVCVGAVAGAYLVTNSDTNMPNVYLDDVYVGGLTKDETIRALDEAGWDKNRGGTLTVTLPEGVSCELDFLRAGAYQPKEEAAEFAFRYGHTADMFDNLETYLKGMLDSVDLSRKEFTIDRAYVAAAVDEAVDEFETVTEGEEYVINEEALVLEAVKGAGQVTLDRAAITDKACALLLAGEHELEWTEIVGEPTKPDFEAVAAALSRDPVDARYDPDNDEIIDEVKGVSFDAAEAERLWEQAGILEKISVPIELVEPEITAESLREVLFHDKLGDCLTYLFGSSANRISNIRVACSKFDGYVLQPGETFSYNEVVGERTAEAGFKYAPAYEGNTHVDQLGGGICQVSSTLYNAVLYANLEINERSCHNMTVAYLPKGLDATVSWGGPEFVFTNNRDYPIKLKAWVDDRGRELTIEVWGTDVDGVTVDLLHAEWPAYDEGYRANYGLDVQVGYGAWMVRRINYPDGSYVDEPKVYSYYHLPDEDIRWPEIPTEDDDGGEEGGGEEAAPAPDEGGGGGEG